MLPLCKSNHIIIISKRSGEVVQGDKTEDEPLSETARQYIKEKYHKPGNVFLGVVHRLGRLVQGLVVFTKISKALTRLNKVFKEGQVHKTYWAIAKNAPPAEEGVLAGWLVYNERQNKSYAHPREMPNVKEVALKYHVITRSDRYHLIEVNSLTSRHHQIRCQPVNMGCVTKGDLKYGASHSSPDGSTSLLARRIVFAHPISKENIAIEAPLPPNGKLWEVLASTVIPQVRYEENHDYH